MLLRGYDGSHRDSRVVRGNFTLFLRHQKGRIFKVFHVVLACSTISRMINVLFSEGFHRFLDGMQYINIIPHLQLDE